MNCKCYFHFSPKNQSLFTKKVGSRADREMIRLLRPIRKQDCRERTIGAPTGRIFLLPSIPPDGRADAAADLPAFHAAALPAVEPVVGNQVEIPWTCTGIRAVSASGSGSHFAFLPPNPFRSDCIRPSAAGMGPAEVRTAVIVPQQVLPVPRCVCAGHRYVPSLISSGMHGYVSGFL